MLSLPAHVLSSATIVVRNLPLLGILLAVTGLLQFGAAETGTPPPMFPPPQKVSHPLADVAATTMDMPSRPSGGTVRVWAESRRQTAALDSRNRWRSEAASFGLAVQLTRGDRGESTHLSALPLPSDPRQTLLRMAASQHVRGWTGSSPSSPRGTHASLERITSEDRIAHALYGPAE